MSETNFNQGEYTYKEDVRQAVFGGYKAFSGLGEQLLSLGEAIEQLRQLFRDIVENTKTDYPESKPYAGLQFVSQEDKDTFGPMSENVSVRFGMSQIHLPISELSHTRIGISIQLDTMMTLARLDEEKRLKQEAYSQEYKAYCEDVSENCEEKSTDDSLITFRASTIQLAQIFTAVVEETSRAYPESKPFCGIATVSQSDIDYFGGTNKQKLSVRFGLSHTHLPMSEIGNTLVELTNQLETMMILARLKEEARLKSEQCCELDDNCCKTISSCDGETTSAIANAYKEELVTTVSQTYDDQLNKCYICDSENLEYPPKRGDYYWATCYDCGASGPIAKSYDEGIKLWNIQETVESKPCCELPVCEDDGCEFDEDATLNLMQGIIDNLYPQSTTNYNLEVTNSCNCRSCDCQ